MPKTKTHRGAAKRFKKTASGRIKRGSAFRRHLLSSKNRQRKRQLRHPASVHETNIVAIEKLLPNG